MSRTLATVLSLLFIGVLWYSDHKRRRQLSAAIWIPVIWLLVLGSRPLSFWMGFGPGSGGEDAQLEGNWFDRTFYLIQILGAVAILARRRFDWNSLFRNNTALLILYLYLFLTLFWSGFPFITFKRWFKEVGAIPVMLLILTEEDPIEALKAVFFRCVYVLIPLSVLFIKYVPELGRAYSNQGGVMYTGVTFQKNSLGEIVLVFSLLMIWDMVQPRSRQEEEAGKKQFFFPLIVLAMGLWCLWISDSKTATICLLIGALVVLSPRLPILKHQPSRIMTLYLVGGPFFLILDKLFGISNMLLAMIGRDSTFTGRTEIWKVVQEHPVNPLFGTGYVMYWDKTGVVEIGGWEAELKTAHNGYLEVYLDGGIIAFVLLLLLLIAWGIRIGRNLARGHPLGTLQFAFFIVIVLYNFSESVFARRGPLWFTFLLLGIAADAFFQRVTEPVPPEEIEEESVAA